MNHQDLVRRAAQKQERGEQLTIREQDALRKWRREQEERIFGEVARRIPQRWWREWSGRQTKVLQEQAARYGIPFAGREIDLPAVVRALHDFLADNAHKLAADAEQRAVEHKWLEEKRREEAQIQGLRRRAMERELLPRAEVHDGLARIAEHLRRAAETLGKQYDAHAAKIVTDGLGDAQVEFDGLAGNPNDRGP